MKENIRMAPWRLSLKVVLTVLLLGLAAQTVLAQDSPTRTITGTVKDLSGEPLAGASVRQKNSSASVMTGADGKYTIKVTGASPILVFSYLGFLSREMPLGKANVLDLTLLSDSKNLEEVTINIGFGAVARKDITGSLGEVNMKELALAPTKSFEDALGGRLAGVTVASFDGQPGSGNAIVIRGNNSLTQDNSPLYVVDGFPLEGFDANTLNPLDIESITVLKDASATAIYGARGANGVILVSTKRGKLGDAVVSFNSYYGVQKDVNRLAVLDPYEFVKLQLELNSVAGAAYTTDIGKTLEDYRGLQGIDWYDKVFRKAGQQNYTMSVSGGSEKTKYSISGNILDQSGIIINSGFKRYQGKIGLDQNVGDKLKLGATINYSRTKENGLIANNNGGSSSFMWTVWGYRPVQADPAENIEEDLLDPLAGPSSPTRTNPFLQVQNEVRDYTNSTFLSTAYLEYSLTPALKLRLAGSASIANGQRNFFNNSKTRSGSTLPGSTLGVNGMEYFAENTLLNNDNTLTYTKRIKKHNFSIMGGYSLGTSRVSTFSAQASNVPNESLGLSGIDEGTPNLITSRISNWGLQSFLSRATYGFADRYTLTATMRADGSSKFAKGSQWGYFPSAAFAWRLSQEKFMKSLSWISDAKIRLGYGATGNNRVDDFAYLASSNFINNGYSFDNQTASKGFVANALGNPDLQWESTVNANCAIDLAFFKSRVALTAEYYDKTTKDLLLNASLPPTTGYVSAFKNIGKVSNRGVEFTLNTENIKSKDFSWSSNFNISFNRNKVLELSENQESLSTTLSGSTTPYYIARLGQPIALFYGLIFDGLYQYDDFNLSSNGTYTLKDNLPSNSTAAARSTIKPGHVKLRDLNNDGIINNNDLAIIGNPNPDFTGGFSNNFNYKGFDLNVFFQFSYGNEIINGNRLLMEEGRFPYTNQFAAYANRWTPENTNTTIPRVLGSISNYNTSRTVEDGSFLRLKTVSLGYNFTPSVLKSLKVRSARLYASAQNLFTWTNYTGVDPEVSVRNTALTPAYDYSPYPRAFTVVAGVALTF
jgi:TonB-linked SusC/RagA family outer membrane protein